MKFIELKTEDGLNKREISFYCEALNISRQGFYKYLKNKNKPWKYKELVACMEEIIREDECNDTYGSIRMYEALKLYKSDEIDLPSERTIYRIMCKAGLIHKPNRKPYGLTKVDKKARKSDDLLKREFKSDRPFEKSVTDITEVKTKDGKLYVSAIFDCYDSYVLGLSMSDNMKAKLCIKTVENAAKKHPSMRDMIVHSDRGSQYTSADYRKILNRYGVIQSMNSDGGRWHDNAKCESMWARMKSELIYGRYEIKKMKMEDVKQLIFRYFMGYWNNRRICSANGGYPPRIKRKLYYEAMAKVA